MHYELEIYKSQANAWRAVCDALDVAYPQWCNLAPRGIDAARLAIKELGEAKKLADGVTRLMHSAGCLCTVCDPTKSGRKFRP